MEKEKEEKQKGELKYEKVVGFMYYYDFGINRMC